MNRLDYYRAVLFGIIVGMVFLTGFYVFTQEDKSEPVAPKSNFEVVDTYKGCELVRWTNNQLSEYKYVLYCPK